MGNLFSVVDDVFVVYFLFHNFFSYCVNDWDVWWKQIHLTVVSVKKNNKGNQPDSGESCANQSVLCLGFLRVFLIFTSVALIAVLYSACVLSVILVKLSVLAM